MNIYINMIYIYTYFVYNMFSSGRGFEISSSQKNDPREWRPLEGRLLSMPGEPCSVRMDPDSRFVFCRRKKMTSAGILECLYDICICRYNIYIYVYAPLKIQDMKNVAFES